MSTVPPLVMQWADWLDLSRHFLTYSLMSIGGPFGLIPEMHRYLVVEHQWLTDAQFSASIVLGQAAPGPNILFIALMGWNLGMNEGGLFTPMLAAIVCLSGILLPSSALLFVTAGWVYRNRELRAVRAFKQGMSPVVISMLIASGWLLAGSGKELVRDWRYLAVTAVATSLVWRTKVHMLTLLAAGAVLGASGMLGGI